MDAKKGFKVKTLLLCLLINGALLVGFALAGRYVLQGFLQAVGPAGGDPGADPAAILEMVRSLVRLVEPYLLPVVLGAGALLTLVLWGLILFSGRHLGGTPAPARSKAAEGPSVKGLEEEVKRLGKELEAARKAASRPTPGPAIQLLSLLQRQGRLVDFLEEDLGAYEDAQIGAAVRSIHQGCKEALAENVKLEPVYEQEEGSRLTVEPGFDARSVRLTGNVKGDPPFQGTLRHRGWRVVRVDLPLKAPDQEKEWIVAPAEVEVA